MSALNYIEQVKSLIEKIKSTQLDKIKKGGEIFVRKIKEDKLIHVIGTGHSHMIAEELFVRAGGLAPVNALLDENVILSGGARRSGKLENLEALAEIIWDEYEIDKDDLMVVISNSGRNGMSVEMALKAKEEGLYLIAITSLEHSRNCESRHSSGKKLYEIVDLVIDNCVPYGDSLLDFNGVKSGPGSTIAGAIIVNSIVAEALKILSEEGYPLPVYVSQNIDGYNNESLFKKYNKRIKHL